MLLNIETFFGRFHPLVVHLPIGFLLLAVFFALLSLKEKYKGLHVAIPVSLLAGSISAAFACITGYVLSQSGDYDMEVLDDHMWAGILTTVVSLLTFFTSIKRMPFRVFYNTKIQAVSLAAVFILVSITGHLGGSLTHGSEYISTSVLWDTKSQKKKITVINDAYVFANLVHPILEDKCGTCHNGSKKKGKLSVATFETIIKGGKHGPAIKPGNITESELVKRISLDPSDKKFMPADGKTPLSKEEAAIIKWWVEKAATGEDKNFISVNPTEEIKKYAAAYLTIGTEESAADVRVSVVAPPLRKETVEELKRAGFSVKYLHFKPDLLDVSLPSGTKDASGKVRSLLQARENIVWLNLSGNSLSDGDLGLINQLTNLEKLKIDNNTITDKGVEKLSGLKALKSINLYNTGVSKDCLSFLQNLPALKRAYVWGTAIKEEDVIPFTSKIQVVTGN